MEKPVAIVTAASQGIGAACARGLVDRGWRVVLLARSEKVHEVAKELGGIALQGSVTDEGDLQKLVDLALKEYGQIDGVHNHTGGDSTSIKTTGPAYDPDLDRSLIEIPDEAWEQGMELYFYNVVRMARVITPVFQKQGRGAIVNTSSLAALEPRLTYPASSAARLALAGYTKLYADRYGKENIRMNNLLPGFVENWPIDPSVMSSIPMNRPVKMEELAGTVAFLLSADAGAITGQNILVDCGVNRSI